MRAGDYSRWLEKSVKDPELASWRVSDLEGEQRLRLGLRLASASLSRRLRRGRGDGDPVAIGLRRNDLAGRRGRRGRRRRLFCEPDRRRHCDRRYRGPGLEVSYENWPVARTDASGQAIVPTLNAYQPNKISIDPRDLPLNASIATTQEVLAPPERSGVLVDCGIRTDVRSAVVILDRAAGQPLQAGLRGKTASGRGFVVGYDGRAFLKDSKQTISPPWSLRAGNAGRSSPMRRKATARSRSDRFGTAGVLATNTDATTTVAPDCTNGSLDGGLSRAANPTQRKMTKAAEFVLYGLYRDSARTFPLPIPSASILWLAPARASLSL